jgi:hypothetical protein
LLIQSGGVGGFLNDGGLPLRSLPNLIGVGGTIAVSGRVEAVTDTEVFCSTTVALPAWQADVGTGCSGRAARHHLTAVVRGPGDLYAHPEWFADILRGKIVCNTVGQCLRPESLSHPCLPLAHQICYAPRGWDGPTGLGEPRHLPWF